MMNILMLLRSTFPPDIRIEKEMDTLKEHCIYLLCMGEKNAPKVEKFKTAKLLRFVPLNALRKLNDIVLYRYNFDCLFFLGLRKAAREIKGIDVIHVHDLLLANTAIRFAKKRKIKVVLDLHENYPEGLQCWQSWDTSFLAKLKQKIFFNYKRWCKFEKKAVDECDHIIAVVEEMKQFLITKHQISDEKITVFSNTEPESFSEQQLDQGIISQYENQFIVSYIGGIGPHRGLDTAIEGMAYIKEDIKLLIVGGATEKVRGHLEKLVDKHQVSQKVEFVGKVPFDQVSSYIALSKICIVPHKDNPHTSNTIPHKLFQYMLLKKPVLVSSCKPLKRVVLETSSGAVFEAGSAKGFSESLNHLYKNSEKLNELGQNAFRSVTDKNTYSHELNSHYLKGFYHYMKEKKDNEK